MEPLCANAAIFLPTLAPFRKRARFRITPRNNQIIFSDLHTLVFCPPCKPLILKHFRTL